MAIPSAHFHLSSLPLFHVIPAFLIVILSEAEVSRKLEQGERCRITCNSISEPKPRMPKASI